MKERLRGRKVTRTSLLAVIGSIRQQTTLCRKRCSVVLLGDSSFCGGTSCRDAVCVGVLRNGHSHAMTLQKSMRPSCALAMGQNIANMTFIEIVIHQAPKECPTPEIYPGSILYNSEWYGNLPEASQCWNRHLAPACAAGVQPTAA